MSPEHWSDPDSPLPQTRDNSPCVWQSKDICGPMTEDSGCDSSVFGSLRGSPTTTPSPTLRRECSKRVDHPTATSALPLRRDCAVQTSWSRSSSISSCDEEIKRIEASALEVKIGADNRSLLIPYTDVIHRIDAIPVCNSWLPNPTTYMQATLNSEPGCYDNEGIDRVTPDDQKKSAAPCCSPPAGDVEAAKTGRQGKLMPQVLAALALAIAAMIEGYSSGYTSPALASMTHENSSIPVTDQQASWVGSLMPLNALIGGMIGGTLLDRFGRKRMLMVIGVPYIISWLLMAFATNIGMIFAGRSIQGLCVGITTLTLPIYLGETIQPEVRGSLGILPTTIGNTGILMCYVFGSFMDWKIMAGIGAFLPVIFLICMWFVPETPRWYMSKGRTEDARTALQWLRGKGTDISKEMKEIEVSQKMQERHQSGIKDLMKVAYLRPLFISLGLMFFQQLSGVNAVIFYTESIFEKSQSSISANLSSIFVGIANFVSTIGANLVIDRVGRKVLLNVSGFFMSLSLLVLGGFYLMQHWGHDISEYGWVPLATFIIYVISFSVGYGPIPWLMMGEIFPAKIRGPAASVATAFNWSCSFVVTKIFQDLMENLGAHGTFWFFGVVCVCSIVFVTLFVPETKGHSLEYIEEKMMEKKQKTEITKL